LQDKELAYKIAQIALEKKGKQVAVMDLCGLTGFTDYFVIISGDSDTHVKALSDHIQKKLKDIKIKIYHQEGMQSLQWVLLDYINVIVHIFRGEKREHYGLERLWGDAKIDLIMDEVYDSR